jgi:glyoxylase-like metal-dependent hydrolase (beta-lactamase superfamily II)
VSPPAGKRKSQMHVVAPGIYFLELEFGQAYLWQRQERLTLIDAGIVGSAGAILDSIAALGRSASDLEEIVLTHYHHDHTGGAAGLSERTPARVVAHRLDAPVIEAQQPQLQPRLEDFEIPIAESVVGKVPPAPPVRVDRLVDDGDSVAGGAVVMHVPGHTPGSLALYIPTDKVLFSGDTIATHNGEPILGVFNVDRAQAVQSAVRQAELGVDVLCVGHGAPLPGGAGARLRQLASSLAV